MVGSTEEKAAVASQIRNSLRRTQESARRSITHYGPERDVLLLTVKSAVAGTLAWYVAQYLLHAPSATFAPFMAVLTVHATISRSLSHSVRYAIAMIGGIAIAGVLSPLLGIGLWAFAAILLLSLVLGRWRKLGSHGSQIAVAAMFAYASFIQPTGRSSWLHLVSIAGLVVLGCVVGVVTNLVLVPPLRYRTAQRSVHALASSLRELLSDMSEDLGSGAPDSDQAQAWENRVRRLPNIVRQTRYSVEDAAETLSFNPRRLLLRENPSFEGYRSTVNTLERAVEHLWPIVRGLTYTTEAEELSEPQREFLDSYAQVLSSSAEAARILGDLHSVEDVRQEDQLDDYVREGRTAYQKLAQQTNTHDLDEPDQWPTYEALYTDARRLVEEFAHTQQELGELEHRS